MPDLDWSLIALAALGIGVIGLIVTILTTAKERRRLYGRLDDIEEAVRKKKAGPPAGAPKFDASGDIELNRERVALTNMLDSFPEVTQKFVQVTNLEELGPVLLAAFRRVLSCTRGVVYVRRGNQLDLLARDGLDESQWAAGRTVALGEGRIGYAAEKCLILTPEGFAKLGREERLKVDATDRLDADFDFYVPMIFGGRAIGCIAVGGMTRIIQKARAACMAVANLGALVLNSLQRERVIRTLSEQDYLTRLSNRRHAYTLLEARLRTKHEEPFAVFLFDIDHFKQINDEHGHAIGDEVLRKLAEEARNLVRPERQEFASRIGGEEFLCILNCEDFAALAARIEDFRINVARIHVETPSDHTAPVQVRVSGGVSFCPAEHDDPDELIRIADDRLYEAKKAGRNRILLESGAPKSIS